MTTNILTPEIVLDAIEKRFFCEWATEYSGTISCVSPNKLTSPLANNTFSGFNSKYITTKSGFVSNNDYEFKIDSFDLISDPNTLTFDFDYGGSVVSEIGSGDEIITGYPMAVKMWKEWVVGGLPKEEPYIEIDTFGGKPVFFENVGADKLKYLMPELLQIDLYAPDQYQGIGKFFAQQRLLITNIFQDVYITQSISPTSSKELWMRAWINGISIKEWEVSETGWYRLTFSFTVNWIQ